MTKNEHARALSLHGWQKTRERLGEDGIKKMQALKGKKRWEGRTREEITQHMSTMAKSQFIGKTPEELSERMKRVRAGRKNI